MTTAPTVSITEVLKQHGSRLVHYATARKELALCNDIDEAIGIGDKAAALRTYAAQIQDQELELLAKRIRLRAERRAGELLCEMEKRKEIRAVGRPKIIPQGNNFKTLPELGIKPKQSFQWKRMAAVPEKKFEEVVESNKPSRNLALKEGPSDGKPKTKSKRPIPFNEDGVLAMIGFAMRDAVYRLWPEDRDLAPVIRKFKQFINDLEQIQKERKEKQ